MWGVGEARSGSRGSAAEPEKPHCYQCDRCYIVVETRCIGQKRRKGTESDESQENAVTLVPGGKIPVPDPLL